MELETKPISLANGHIQPKHGRLHLALGQVLTVFSVLQDSKDGRPVYVETFDPGGVLAFDDWNRDIGRPVEW